MHSLESSWLVWILALAVVSSPGGRRAESAPQVVIRADRYVGASGPVDKVPAGAEGETVRPRSKEGWLSYEAEVPAAGRYRCEVRVASLEAGGSVLWVEDYIDNKDGRTYDITAPMPVASPSGTEGAFTTVAKDGCPLNAGPHRMKVHFSGRPVQIAWIRFTLMKHHQLTPTTMVQRTEGEQWELVWADEFDGSGLPDPAKWTADIGNWGWGNREPQYYTEGRVENARREGGHLIIEARKNDLGHAWTSARLTTRGKVSFVYGKIELRAKVPGGKGTWAAGWLLGDAYRDEISWPYCGEIDVLEAVGREIDDHTGDGTNHASCHTRAYYFKQGNQISSTTRVENMSGRFHTYTAEWTPEAIRVYLDGKHYYTYDKTKNKLEWPFHEPQNLILNLAMGGGMGGEIDPTVTSRKFIIDYVRVYGRR